MKSKVLIPLTIILLLMSFALPVNAQLIPDVTGGYTLTTSPAVDPSTGAIIVTPGQTITLDATATVTYSGAAANGVRITVSVYTYLYQAGVEKASSSQSYQATYDLSTGNTYTVENSTSITVPASAEPGSYLLKVVASASAEYLGLTYNEAPVVQTYRVIVVSLAASPGTPVTPTPVPTPVPTPARTPSTFGVDGNSVNVGSDGKATFKSGEVTGTTDAGAASGSVDVSLTHVPAGSLNMYVTTNPDPAAETQFMLAAADSGNDIADIAYVLVVEHPALANGADISSATVTMKVSKAWVDAHGGISAIRILRYSDGASEELATTCLNPGGDPLIFQAYSPHGLSQFALAAVARLPVTAAESAPAGVQLGTSIVIGIVAVIIIGLVAIIGLAYMLTHRKKKEQ